MNSTYDYDPASRKDELVDRVKKAAEIMGPVLRPDVALVIQAFPWCESITFLAFHSITRSIFQVTYIPSWFPCMSFKKEMAVARALTKQYLDKAFEHSLRKVVRSSQSLILFTRSMIASWMVPSRRRWCAMHWNMRKRKGLHLGLMNRG